MIQPVSSTIHYNVSFRYPTTMPRIHCYLQKIILNCQVQYATISPGDVVFRLPDLTSSFLEWQQNMQIERYRGWFHTNFRIVLMYLEKCIAVGIV